MFSKDRVNLRRNSGKIYITIVSFLVLGMMFFLTSGFIFKEKINVLASPINEDIKVSSNTGIKIYEWIYDERKNKMQVIIDTNDLSNDYKTFNFKAYQRSDGKEVGTKILYRDNGMYVVGINDFDEDYIQIALDVLGIEETSDAFIETKTDEENNEEKDKEQLIKTLYTDYRTVEKKDIGDFSSAQYLSYLNGIIIEDINSQIKENKGLIKEYKEKIKEQNKMIDEINEEKLYQTEEEKINSDSNIDAAKIKINSLEEDIKQLNLKNKMLHDKTEKIKRKEMEKMLE